MKRFEELWVEEKMEGYGKELGNHVERLRDC